MVREYKGSHSGEHGDGIVRSEFHEPMFGARLVRAFEEVKDRFDPNGLFNPGKIVRAPKFDDRTLFRYAPGLSRRGDRRRSSTGRPIPAPAAVSRARSRCATTTAPAASSAGGVMCPSYRVTRDERDVTRGRANTLRLAITGQLGPDALTSDEMAETLKLCVSCKACRRECPTGVDMARMKIEVQAARAAKHGLSLHDRLVGYLPRYAPYAAQHAVAVQPARPHAAAAAGCRKRSPASRARRSLPQWRARHLSATAPTGPTAQRRRAGARGRAVRRHLQPLFRARESRRRARACWPPAAIACMSRKPPDGDARPLCCGRTFLVGRPGRRGAARGASARSRRSRRSSRAACRWSGWSRAACSASATRCRR